MHDAMPAIRSLRYPLLRVPGLQAVRDIFKAEAAIGQQYDQVINEISRLVDSLLLRSGRGRQCQLDAFLADFLCNAFGAGCSEPCGIAFITSGGKPCRYDDFELSDECNIGSIHVVPQILISTWFSAR